MKQCVSCLQWKEETEFNWRYKALGIRHKICRECQNGHQERWYRRHREAELERVKERKQRVREESRELVYNYLLTHPCEMCGETDPRVLEFHYPGGKQKRTINAMIAEGYRISAIQAEIEKCQVLCANCRRKRIADEKR